MRHRAKTLYAKSDSHAAQARHAGSTPELSFGFGRKLMRYVNRPFTAFTIEVLSLRSWTRSNSFCLRPNMAGRAPTQTRSRRD
jgi:hypothetical protein